MQQTLALHVRSDSGVQVNDKVTFALALSEKGHPRATSVKLIGQVAAR